MPDEERWVKFYNKDGEYVALARLTQFSYDDYMKNGKYTKPVEYEVLIDVKAVMKAKF